MKLKAKIIVFISSCFVIYVSWMLGLIILGLTIFIGLNAYCANSYHVKRLIRYNKELNNLDFT